MQPEDRIANYVRETGYPQSLFVAADGRIVGTWIMGNSYRVRSGFYGGYPDTYLKRIKALFPDKQRVLHVFSGRVDQSVLPGDTVDINPNLLPTFVDDAQHLENVPLDHYDLVLADPPYSVEDSERYQTSMIKRNTVMAALSKTSAGTHVVWLDQVLPMYSKKTWAIEAVIGMVKSTNHRFRVVTVFRRLGNDEINCCVIARKPLKTIVVKPKAEKSMQITVTLNLHASTSSVAIQQWMDLGLRLETPSNDTAPMADVKTSVPSKEQALFNQLVATKKETQQPPAPPVQQQPVAAETTGENSDEETETQQPTGALPPGVTAPLPKRKGGRPSKADIAAREAAAAAAAAAVNPAFPAPSPQPSVVNGTLPQGLGGGGGARPPGANAAPPPPPQQALQQPAMPAQQEQGEEYSNGAITKADVQEYYTKAINHDPKGTQALLKSATWPSGETKPRWFSVDNVLPMFYDRLYSELWSLVPEASAD